MTMQKLLSKARKAIQDFDMIQENDKIAVDWFKTGKIYY